MRKIKIIALILALALCLQIGVCAVGTDAASGDLIKATQIQPRGRYLLSGTSILTPYTGYIKVSGSTEAYDDVDELTIELRVFRVSTSGTWTEIWSDSISATDDYEVTYPTTRINVTSKNYYAIESTHTVTHNGVTETCYSETDPVYVY
ncbi:MAG: hypothetical protein E7392_06500 [Ruminococcaceae bacterium]|nr:hypothetical protein [Oscillospiraceae bacterium]